MSYTADGDILACVLSLTSDESISALHVYRSTDGGLPVGAGRCR